MLHFIYSVKDKKTGIVGYIGVTNNPNARMIQHLEGRDMQEEKNAWFQEIDPEMDILEVIKDGRKYALVREKYWIQYYIQQGIRLLNTQCIKIPKPSRQLRLPKLSKLPKIKKVKPVPPYYIVGPPPEGYIRAMEATQYCRFIRPGCDFIHLAEEYGVSTYVDGTRAYYRKSDLDPFVQRVGDHHPYARSLDQCAD